MIYPNKVLPASKIGLTAMSSGIEDNRDLNKIENGIKNIIDKGFEIVETSDVRTNQKLVSANAKKRAEEFLSLWEREDIPYIVIAFGGEFLMETLPYLDKEKIKACTPKWVQGFSDVSLLLFYLTTNFNIATVHANSFSTYGMNIWDKSVKMPFNFVQNPMDFKQESFELFERERNRDEGTELNSFNLTDEVVYKNLYDGNNINITGRLIGGCVDVLRTLLGTPFDNTKEFCNSYDEGMLWYIENCEMSVADLKRTLWQMKTAGWFDNANGFIIGRTRASAPFFDFTYEDALHDIFDDLNVPVIYDVDFGHVAPQWTMINGAFAEFTFESGKGAITQKLT